MSEEGCSWSLAQHLKGRNSLSGDTHDPWQRLQAFIDCKGFFTKNLQSSLFLLLFSLVQLLLSLWKWETHWIDNFNQTCPRTVLPRFHQHVWTDTRENNILDHLAATAPSSILISAYQTISPCVFCLLNTQLINRVKPTVRTVCGQISLLQLTPHPKSLNEWRGEGAIQGLKSCLPARR